jgi:eukaryotic-like serine/threonine-protein kinase
MAEIEQKYRIIEKLDSGGMAEIYRGEAESVQGFKKQVAIKRILPHLTKNQKFVAMFLDEARLCLFLNHANIVHVFDIGRSGATFFIVMEFVDGLNLRTMTDSLRRQNRRVDLARAIYILMEICKGLGYAHDMTSPDGKALGIVHRDVSPPNILLSKAGEVKLVDFGLAKAASQLEQTDPGVVKGKFSYLSPEAASGIEVDFRADIFSAGIILFEMLTARRLFYGETDYQTVELVRQARVPSLCALNPEVPTELDQIVHRALARDPDQRFQHAYELQDALAQFLFSRSLKVTSRDVAWLVRECLAERQQTLPPAVHAGSVIDTLIEEEMGKFTSLDATENENQAGAKPLSPEEIGGSRSGPLDPQDFIDPRAWTSEMGGGGESKPEVLLPRPVRASDLPEVTSLEQMLEGEGQSTPVRKSDPPQKPRKKAGMWKGLIIALLVFIVLGAATVFVLHTLGLLRSDSGAGDNQDIVKPE